MFLVVFFLFGVGWVSVCFSWVVGSTPLLPVVIVKQKMPPAMWMSQWPSFVFLLLGFFPFTSVGFFWLNLLVFVVLLQSAAFYNLSEPSIFFFKILNIMWIEKEAEKIYLKVHVSCGAMWCQLTHAGQLASCWFLSLCSRCLLSNYCQYKCWPLLLSFCMTMYNSSFALWALRKRGRDIWT